MLDIQKENDVTIASFMNIERFNSSISSLIKEELLPHIIKENSKLVLDLEDIIFIDSSGFSVLIYLLRSSKTTKSSIVLCNISKEVMDEIKIMQLDTVFVLANDRKEAVSKAQTAVI